jgi:putative DNA primase/helicase
MHTNCNSEIVSAGEYGRGVNIDGIINGADGHSMSAGIEARRDIDVERQGVWNAEGCHEQLADYKILDVQSFLEQQVSERMIYLDPLVRKEGIVMVTGYSGVGKTMFTLGLCKSLVSGEALGNWEVRNRAKVLYVDGELPAYLLQERVRGFSINEGFFVLASSLNLDMTFSLGSERFRERIKQELIEKEFGVCVFDNLSSLTPRLDENSKRDWDPINQYLLDLRRYGITVITVHHTTKNKKEQRGTSGRIDNIDVWCNLERNENTGILTVTFNKWRYEPNDLLKHNTFKMNNYDFVLVGQPVRMTEKKKKILEMLSQDIPQAEISRELDVSQPYISKLKSHYQQENLIDGDSRLTEKGRSILATS